jgi:hypothetical protein
VYTIEQNVTRIEEERATSALVTRAQGAVPQSD